MNAKKMITLSEEELTYALLVSIKTPSVSDKESADSLTELERLVNTLGHQVISKQYQRQQNTTGKTVVGEGKLEELVTFIKESKEVIDLVIFDCELTPSQIRNVENAVGAQVMDRTGVIIEIFGRHAKSKAAQIQVEIARLNYLAPRLREKKQTGDRQHFAGRGAGEDKLELDKRRVRDKKAELKRELEQVQIMLDNHRTQRQEQLSVALVGYTNAGKSSAMRALTESQVLVENKLFATLDTTVRALHPETHPRILISDTVGFIKKLPHDLVASFHSTLEEARQASLLLYIVDAADESFRSQLTVVKDVLTQISANTTPSLLIFNKADQLNLEQKNELQKEFADALIISTFNKSDIQKLHQTIVDFFDKTMIDAEIFVPFHSQGIVGEIHASTKILEESCDNEGTHFKIRSTETEIERLKKKLVLG